MPYINVDEAYILDNTGLQVDNSVDYANANSNRNLLDNPWFTINQRSATTIPVGGYGVDRWKGGSAGAANVVSGGLQFSGAANAYQVPDSTFFSLLVGKTATASLLFSDGTVQSGTKTITNSVVEFGTFNGVRVYISSSHNFNMETSAGASVTIRAVKLELGSYSTLINDTPPDYGEELRKCQRYFYRMDGTNANYTSYGFCVAVNASTAELFVNTPVVMRVTPTVTYGGTFQLRDYAGSNTRAISAMGVDTRASTTLKIAITASTLTVGWFMQLRGAASPTYIDFSADL